MLESFGKFGVTCLRGGKPERLFELCKEWHSDIGPLLLESGIHILSLEWRKGWRAKNLDFLYELPFIDEVQLWGYWGTNFDPIDLSALSQCTWLKKIKVDINNSIKVFPNLSKLTTLEDLEVVMYRQLFNGDLHIPSLKVLHIVNSLKLISLDLSKLKKLNYLHLKRNKALRDVIISPEVDLHGFESVMNPRLFTIDGLSEVLSKCTIWLGRSPKFNLHDIPKNTEELQLWSMGKIPNLKFLSNYKELSCIFLHGTTDIVDGDLSVLLSLPKLRTLNMEHDRKHYSHKLAELRNLLPTQSYQKMP